MTSEARIQSEIMLAAGSIPGVRLFRNQVGSVKVDGRWIRYGLHKGSSDLFGWVAREIRPEDVGATLARALSIEVKSPAGRLSPAQETWRDVCWAHGVLYLEGRDAGSVRDAIRAYLGTDAGTGAKNPPQA